MIDIVLQIRPEPYKRMRQVFKNGRAMLYSDPEYRSYKEAIMRLVASKYRDDPLSGCLDVQLTFGFKNPQAHAKKPVPRPYHPRPDIDNLAKAIMDACNGVLWDDDGQITSLSAQKIYADFDFVQIAVGVHQ